MSSGRYQVCEWHHDLPTEPVRLWSEIDADGWEVRKIEIYRDGAFDVAAVVQDQQVETGSTRLSTCPLPAIAEINRDPQFSASAATFAEFEAVWIEAMSQPALRAQLSGMSNHVEMRAQVVLTLNAEREKPLWGERNRSVIFSFDCGEDKPLNLMVEFSTATRSHIEPGSAAACHARFLGPLWMVSVVLEGAQFSLLMGEVIGTGTVGEITQFPPYGRP